MSDTTPQPQYDPIVGTVYGNVLDKFDNYAYNIKLYMIPPKASPVAAGVFTPSAGTTARNPLPTPSASGGGSGGGYLKNYLIAKPEETVVLAQTGVTGAQIDNVQIVSAVGTGGSFHTSTINFDVIQPGSADFMDQILAAKKHLGCPIFAPDVPLFLEIVFKGYSEDIDDPEKEGVVTAIAGPYRYNMILKNVGIDIDAKGSQYSFECVAKDQIPYSDQFYTLPCLVTAEGGTIKEYLTDVENKLKEYAEKNLTDYQFRDEIKFDLSGLLVSEGADPDLGISDDTLTNNSKAKAEDINRIMNPQLSGKTQDEYKEILEGDPIDSGRLDVVVSKDMVTFREGVKIDVVVATILSMSDEFFEGTTRSDAADAGANVRKEQGFVKWFKINSDYEYGEYDEYRNTHQKKITYGPYIYRTDGSNIQQNTEENINLSKSDVQSRFDQMSATVFKAYHYTYTGRNDQIIDCRIGYNNGIALIVPPAGGVTGDFSTALADSLSDTAGENDDLTGQEAAQAAEKAAAAEQANDFLNNLDPGQRQQLGEWAGLSGAEIADLVSNQNGQSQQFLALALADSSLLQAAQNAGAQANANTLSDTQKGINGGSYSERLSGYQYGADIMDSQGLDISQDMSQQTVKNRIRDLRRQAKNLDSESQHADAGDNAQPQVQQIHLTNPSEAATYDGTTRNSIFGYLMQQHGASDFLVKLDMTVRGDPFYLGQPDTTGRQVPLVNDPAETNPEYAVYSKDENYVMFEMQLPRRYDMDVEDEDNNTSYWQPKGTSYFISGMYRMVTVVNNFSRGLYSTELNLNKLTPIKISMLEKHPPGESE